MFYQASAFNQDVSKWNMGAVTIMQSSKCTLSLYDNSSFIGSHFSHVLLFLVCVFDTVPFLLFVVGWSFFSLLAPSLAVFRNAYVFNQDVPK